MDTERWSTLSVLLDELIELEPPARTRRLAEIETVDPPLAEELRKLPHAALELTRNLAGGLGAAAQAARDALVAHLKLQIR
mgnify:CR=1 FL=1